MPDDRAGDQPEEPIGSRRNSSATPERVVNKSSHQRVFFAFVLVMLFAFARDLAHENIR